MISQENLSRGRDDDRKSTISYPKQHPYLFIGQDTYHARTVEIINTIRRYKIYMIESEEYQSPTRRMNTQNLGKEMIVEERKKIEAVRLARLIRNLGLE